MKDKNIKESAASANGITPYGCMNNRNKLIKDLVETWLGKGDREVAEYSYFSSMKYANTLDEMGLGFIGVSK